MVKKLTIRRSMLTLGLSAQRVNFPTELSDQKNKKTYDTKMLVEACLVELCDLMRVILVNQIITIKYHP